MTGKKWNRMKGNFDGKWNIITFGNAIGAPRTAGETPKSNAKMSMMGIIMKIKFIIVWI
jgi:hypothetical protein